MSLKIKKNVFRPKKRRVSISKYSRRTVADLIPSGVTIDNNKKRKQFSITAKEVGDIEASVKRFEKKIERDYAFDPDLLGMHFQ